MFIRMMRKWFFIISVLLNILFIIGLIFSYLNSPTHELGRLKKDITITHFSSNDTVFYLPKGLTVRNISPRGLASIGQFENNRFEIVITSDNELVDYDVVKDSLQNVGNYYSADSYKHQ